MPRLSPRDRAFLTAILIAGLVVRVAYLAYARSTPGYAWEDPDQYIEQAVKMATGEGGWRWSFEAAAFDIYGTMHALPPGYTTFLSVFAAFPGFPLSAQVAQVLLAVVTIGLVFGLGRIVHSVRAGLIAAGLYAVWVPSIINVWSASQEALFLPVLLGGLVLLARATVGDAKPVSFLLAGLTFAFAALTRSTALFLIAPAALLHVAIAPARRQAAKQAAALLLGFAVVVVPYSAALSRHFGRLAIVDTHGGLNLSGDPTQATLGLGATARAIWDKATGTPAAFAGQILARAKALFHPNGGRILEIYTVARTKLGATVWKVLAHIGVDGLLLLTALLAPFGAVLCLQRRVAAVLFFWILVNIAIVGLSGFAGARFRAPFEPVLVVLAAVVMAGQWQRPSRRATGVAALLAVTAAVAILPQLPRSLSAHADYGVTWPSVFQRRTGHLEGRGGFSLPVASGSMSFAITPDSGPNAAALVEVRLSVNGGDATSAVLSSGETRSFTVPVRRGPIGFVDLDVRRRDNGRAAGVKIDVRR